MREINPMHVMSLRRPSSERAVSSSLSFLKWILNSARFTWSNVLLIVIYFSYLLFGTHMLIESEQGQVVVEEDLVALRKENVRNEILFFSLYNGYISSPTHASSNNNLAKLNDHRISQPNSQPNDNSSFNRTVIHRPYVSRDRELRLRIDKGLNELENEIKRYSDRAKLRANLSRFNATFFFVVRLLTTLGNDQTDLLLTYGSTHSKLFVVFYSLVGIPFTVALAYHHGQLLIGGLSRSINKLCARTKKRIGRTKSGLLANGRPKKRDLESSSLLDAPPNDHVQRGDSASSRVNRLIESSLDPNLKFVLQNRSSIVLPNSCVNLNRFSLADPYNLNTFNYGNDLCSSISHNELNNYASVQSPTPGWPSISRHSINSTINLPAWPSHCSIEESANNSLNRLVGSNSMNSSTINLTNRGAFCDHLVSYNSVNNLIGPVGVRGRQSMPNNITRSSFNLQQNRLKNPRDAYSYADLQYCSNLDSIEYTRSLPFEAANRIDLHQNSFRSDPYRNGLYRNEIEHSNGLYANIPYQDLYQVSYQNVPDSPPLGIGGLVPTVPVETSNARPKSIKSLKSSNGRESPPPELGGEERALNWERDISISLLLVILALYLFMISFLLHRTEQLPLLDAFTLTYLSISLNGIAGYSPKSPYFIWINSASVYFGLVLLLTFIRIVCKRLSAELKLIV